MRNKLFIFLYTAGIVLGVVLLNVVVTTIKKNPAMPPGPEELADTSIAQFMERSNSTRTDGETSRLFFLIEYFFPRTESLEDGCALRFSLVPEQKAVEPQGTSTYTLTVANKGKDVCENASLSMYYTETETFVSSYPEPTASDYYWAFGNLDGGRTATVMLTTKTSQGHGTQFYVDGCATADNASDICAQTVVFVQTGASKETSLTERLRIPFAEGGLWGWLFREKEFGIWIWDSPYTMNPAYAKEVISVSRKNGFNVLYVTVDDYLEVLDMPLRERASYKENYMKSLSIFVDAAQDAGLEVDAVGGAKDWAMSDNRRKGYELIEFVKEYNKKYPRAKLRGLQYDVEPYLLTEYNADKQKVLKEFVTFIDESARRMKDMPEQFSIVIPHFYDSKQNWTPEYSYRGEKASTFTHLLNVLKQKKESSIIIMSYRNFFEGENGTKEISEAELEESSNREYPTKIIIAQETGNVTPDYVTFYDYPKLSLFDALQEMQEYFKKYKAFDGVAVHYFDSFLKME